MFDSEVVFPIVRQALVECTILFLSNVVGVTRPDGLGLVQLLVGGLQLLNLLGLLLLLLIFVLDLLDLGLILFVLDFLFLVFNLL